MGWIDGDGSIEIDLLICPTSVIVQLLASFHCAQVTAESQRTGQLHAGSHPQKLPMIAVLSVCYVESGVAQH